MGERVCPFCGEDTFAIHDPKIGLTFKCPNGHSQSFEFPGEVDEDGDEGGNGGV